MKAGRLQTVEPRGENVKLVVPLTLNWRYETLLYILHSPGCAWHHVYSWGVTYCASAKYVAPGFRFWFRSSTSTLTRCDTPSCEWPLWLFAVDGKAPVKGLTHAREPMPLWFPFKLAEYGSEHPEPRCDPPTPLQPKPQTFCVNAVNACLSQDWPICSNRSVLSAPPLIRYRFCGMTG